MAIFSSSTKSNSWDDYKKWKEKLGEMPEFSTEGQETINSGIGVIQGADPNAATGTNTINTGANYLLGLPEFSSDGVDAISTAISGINGMGTFSSNGTDYMNQGLNLLTGMKPFESQGYGYMQSGLEGLDKMGTFESEGIDGIKQGLKGLQELGTFDSEYADLYGDAIKNYANMGKFQYNLAGDPLFNQYKDNYTQMGKTAMQDTMGQAAALTGGYGNSYAAAAGQQAYNSYMSELNNRIPELYSLALQNYNTEASRLQNVANMYGSAIDRDLNTYNANRGYYGDVISGGSTLFNADLGKYNADMNRYGQMVTSGGQMVDADKVKYYADIDRADALISGGGQLVDADATTYSTNLGRHTALGTAGAQKVTADSTVYNNKLGYGQSLGDIGAQQVDASDTVFDNTISQGNSIVSAGDTQVSAENTAKTYTMNYLTNVLGMSFDDAKYVTDMIYNEGRDEVADGQWQQEFDYNEGRDEVADNQWQKTFDWTTSPDNPSNQTKTTGSGGTATPQTAADGSTVPEGYTTPQFKGFSYTGNISSIDNKDGTTTYTDKNGKTKKVKTGTNPYTGKMNPRVQTNGEYDPSKSLSKNYKYMPDTAPNGQKLTSLRDSDGNKVKATFLIADSDGNYWGDNKQTIWKTTGGGRGTSRTIQSWAWDVTANEYVQVQRDGSGWKMMEG